MNVLYVSVNRLQPGMITVENVQTAGRRQLAAKNTVLNHKLITSFKLHGIEQIPVIIPDNLMELFIDDDPRRAHMDKIEGSGEFKKFKKAYLAMIDSLKKIFAGILEDPRRCGTPDEILADMQPLLAECGNSMHTFDMLHCIRKSDDLTYVHSLNVALICHSLAAWLNYSENDKKLLTVAGLLHDIGKMMIPEEILTKPIRLTDEEYKTMKSHTTLGARLLGPSNLDPRIKEAVLSHHERYDGSGYPDGKTGDKVGAFAKAVAIADVYDAMTSNRTYRYGICPFEVVETLEKDGYSKYDPGCLIPFLTHLVQSYINARVMLSNTLVGEVVMINNMQLSKPIVKVDNQFFDLSKKTDIRIQYVL